MHAWGQYWFREEKGKRFGEGDAGVRHAEQNLDARSEWTIHNNSGGGTLLGAVEIAFVFSERQITALRSISRGKAFESEGALADDFSAKMFGNFSSSEWHKLSNSQVFRLSGDER